MAITGQNYKNNPNPEVGGEIVFEDCNFEQSLPIDTAGVLSGIRLFPGDDTPKTFIHCRLINCELPPNSTMERCGVVLVLRDAVIATQVYVIDGVDISVDTLGTKIVKGGNTKLIGEVPPPIAEIDTTTQQYAQLRNAVTLLDTQTISKLAVYGLLAKGSQQQFLQRDPLFKETLQLILKVQSVIGDIQGAE